MINKNTRNSNIELLRIISMLLIIGFHMKRYGFAEISSPFIVYLTANVFGLWGILGVDVFVIISCWYLVEKEFHIRKIIDLLVSLFAYNFIFSFVSLLVNYKDLIHTFADIVYDVTSNFFSNYWCSYWFVRAYIIMLFVSPILNKVLKSLKPKLIKKILIIFIFIPIMAQVNNSYVTDAIYFCYIYLLVGYWKKNDCKLTSVASYKSVIILGCLILVFNVLEYFPLQNAFVQDLLNIIISNTIAETGRHSFVLLFDAFLLFFAVIKQKPFYSPFINKIASLTFGVYLFHENGTTNLFNMLGHIVDKLTSLGFIKYTSTFPLQYILIILFVFTVGCLFETCQKVIIHNPCMKILDKKCSYLFESIDKWFNI